MIEFSSSARERVFVLIALAALVLTIAPTPLARASDEAPVEALSVPSAPSVAIARGAGGFAAFLTADPSGPPISHYDFQYERAGFGVVNGTAMGNTFWPIASGLGNNAAVAARFRAVNAEGPGAWTHVNTTTLSPLPAAKNLAAVYDPGYGVTVTWDPPVLKRSDSIRDYGLTHVFRVESAETLAGPWELVGETDAWYINGRNEIADLTFNGGEPRFYRVAGYTDVGRGAWATLALGETTETPTTPHPQKECTITSTGPMCSQGTDQPVYEVYAGGSQTCVTYQDNVDCWGLDRNGQASDRLLTTEVRTMAMGPMTTCTLGFFGEYTCYGLNVAHAGDGMRGNDFVQSAIGLMHACHLRGGTPGYVTCEGISDRNATAGRGWDVLQVAAGKWHTCFLLVGGNVECQGDNAYGQVMSYQGGDAIKVTAGSYHTCVLTSAGRVVCAGDNGDGQSIGFETGALDVSAGAYHTCALIGIQDGLRNALCTGDDSGGQSAPYLFGSATALATGEMHTCVQVISTVECWGSGAGISNAGQGTSYPTQSELSPPADTPWIPGIGSVVTLGALLAVPLVGGKRRTLAIVALLAFMPLAAAQLPEGVGVPTGAPLVVGRTIGAGESLELSSGPYVVTGMLTVAAGGSLLIERASLGFDHGAGIIVESGGSLSVQRASFSSSVTELTPEAFPVDIRADASALITRSHLTGVALRVAADDALIDRTLVDGSISTFVLDHTTATVRRGTIEGLPLALFVDGGAPLVQDMIIREADTCVWDEGSAATYRGDLFDGCALGIDAQGSALRVHNTAFMGPGTGTGLRMTGASVDARSLAVGGWSVGIAMQGSQPLAPARITFTENALDVDLA